MGQVLNIFLGFYLSRLMVGSLDLEQVGLWHMLQDLAGYYSLSDLGIGRATTKYLSTHAAANNRQAFFQVLGTSLKTSRWLALVALGITVVLALGLPAVIQLGSLSRGFVGWLIVLTGLRVCSSLAAGAYHSVPVALGAYQLSNTILFTISLVGSIALLLSLRLGGGLVAMSLIALATQIVYRSVYIIASHRLIEFPPEGLPLTDPKTRRELFEFGLVSFLIQAAQRVVSFSSSILIAIFSNLENSALYGIAQSLSNKSRAISKTISDQLMPAASRLHGRQDPQLMLRFAVLSCRVLGLISLVFLINIATLGVPFFKAWLGKPDVAAAVQPIAVLLLAGALVKLTVGGLVTSLEGMGSMTVLGRICAIEAVLTLTLQALSLRWFGMLGMAVALLVCQVFVNGLLLNGIAARALRVSPVSLFLRIWSPLLVAAIPGLGVGWACGRWLPAESIWMVLAEFSLVGATLMGVGIVTCLDREGQRDLRQLIGRRFGQGRAKSNPSAPVS